MKQLLARYHETIRDFHPELDAVLRPGLPRDEIERKLDKLPFRITADAVDLYEWADGVDNAMVALIPISYFMPLDYALESFFHLLPTRAEFESIFPQSYGDSFPFLSDHSDGGYGFGSLDPPCNGRIIDYLIHEEWAIAFNSLPDMIETAIKCYEDGALENDGSWDIERFFTIANEMNPCRTVD